MVSRALAWAYVTALALFIGTLAHANASAPMFDDDRGVMTIAPTLEKVTPGVVNISVVVQKYNQPNPLMDDPFFRRFFGAPGQPQPQPREAHSAGSGVIVDAQKGYVLTNHHVIDHARKITVTLTDQRSFKAELIGSDPGTDVALLKIEPEKLTDVPLGRSEDLKVGDFVVAVGNPFGIGQTVTSGIVSALGRSGLGIEGYEDFIQTDASINPGNSGGALINSKGELIGINTAIIGPNGGNIGIGFAVPSDMAKAVMTQLINHGEVRRGMLGVTVQDLSPDIAAAMDIEGTRGAMVTSVAEDSAAEKAGLEAGDVITAVNGEQLDGSTDLRNRIGLVPSGTTVTLTVLRDGAIREVSATIEAARFAADNSATSLRKFLTGAALSSDGEGVLLTQVQQGSPAWSVGFRNEDRIVAINNTPVDTVDELGQALSEDVDVAIVNLMRQDRNHVLVLRQ